MKRLVCVIGASALLVIGFVLYLAGDNKMFIARDMYESLIK